MSWFKKRRPFIAGLEKKRDVKGLIKALTSGRDPTKKRRLIKALTSGKNPYIQREAAIALGKLKNPKAVKPLIKALTSGKDLTLQREAAIALGKLQNPKAVKPLIKALTSGKDLTLQWEAVKALGKLKNPKAVKPLLAVLKQHKVGLKSRVEEAILEIGSPTVHYLLKHLHVEDGHLKPFVIISLGKIGDVEAVEPLISALLKEKYRFNKSLIVEALGDIGDIRAVEPILAVCRDVGPTAAKALLKVGWKPSSMKEHVGHLIVAQEREKLIEIGKPAFPYLIESLKDSRTRRISAEVLGKIGDVKAIEPLISALIVEQDVWTQASVTDALVDIGGVSAVNPLLSALHAAHINKNGSIRVPIVWTLGMIYKKTGNTLAKKALDLSLEDGNFYVRREAGKFLGLWT